MKLRFQPRRLQVCAAQHYGAGVVFDHIGDGDAQGGQDAGAPWHQHAGDAELGGQFAGVHRAGAAKRHEGEVAGVVAAFQRDGADGALHIGIDDADDAQGGVGGRGANAGGKVAEQVVRPFPVQRHSPAEEAVGAQAAQRQVGVGYGNLRALAVAGGAGVGAGGLRADRQGAAGVDAGDGTAAGAHGVNFNHRDADRVAAQAGGGGFLDAAGAEGYVGGGAAHIQCDDVGIAGLDAGVEGAHHAAGRAAEDSAHRLFGGQAGGDAAAGGLHNTQAAAQHGFQPGQVAGHHGAYVGVDYYRAGALVFAELREDLR